MSLSIITKNEAETKRLAKEFASKLSGGETLALVGDLGAGKTTFLQGLAEGLEVKEKVNSPTFVVMKVYPGKLQFVHVDAYRAQNEEDIKTVGISDYLGQNNSVTAIEWADKIEKMLPKNTIWIYFEEQDDERKITISRD